MSLETRNSPVTTEPRWRPEAHFTNAELPPRFRSWLLDDGSLTRRLIDMHRGQFRVTRLFQGWRTPLPSEQRLLDIAPRQQALVREVVLTLDHQPVVFARSVFPHASLTGPLTHLRRLQNRSLGEILFRNPRMQRSPFELSLIPGNSAYLHPELRQALAAWGRRSRFDISGRALMVSEVFLQKFTPWQSILPVHRSQRGRVNAAIAPAKQSAVVLHHK